MVRNQVGLYFAKGRQLQFWFDRDDMRSLLQFVFEQDWVVFDAYVDSAEEQQPIETLDHFDSHKGTYLTYYWILPTNRIEQVQWRTISLTTGGTRYAVDNLLSRTVQLLYYEIENGVLSPGRIALSKEWVDDDGRIHQADYELDVYRGLSNAIRRLSQGKEGGFMVGKGACQKWFADEISLWQGSKERFVPLRKS